ncbi:hypothetical protein [Ensifer soli]|uniref:hypothetical protein n=1 Tax=Ciceribacter sp. sgz301302 TaxID=3342379 RepID=UPI0035BA2680
MRRIVLFLLIFSAVISGPTVTLARLSESGRMTVDAHHGTMAHPCDADHGTACRAHGKAPVHPLLCAACFALSVDLPVAPARHARVDRLAPATVPAIPDRRPRPQVPPPR